MKLLSNLKDLKCQVERGCSSNVGICGMVLFGPDGFNPDDELLLDNIFRLWPEWSGSVCYPVPAPKNTNFTHYIAFEYLPKWSGEYGELRKDLLNFCIEYLEESLK